MKTAKSLWKIFALVLSKLQTFPIIPTFFVANFKKIAVLNLVFLRGLFQYYFCLYVNIKMIRIISFKIVQKTDIDSSSLFYPFTCG